MNINFNNKRFWTWFVSIAAGALAAGGALFVSNKLNNNEERPENIYRMDIDEEDLQNIRWIDENGEEHDNPEIQLNYDSDIQLATFTNDINDNEDYYAFVIDGEGRVAKAKVPGKYIDEDVLQEIPIENNDDYSDLFVVAHRDGVWLRQNTKLDRDTEDAELLQEDVMLIADKSVYVANDNNYTWRKVIYYDGDELKSGYMADDYLVNADLDKAKGEHYTVTTDGIGLKVRDNPSFDGEVIDNIEDGTRVLRVPNHMYITDESCDWAYIAYEEDGEVRFGYSAAKFRNNGREHEYLTFTEEIREDEDLYISPVVVNTDRDKGIDLNLRSESNLDSEIVAKIENKSTIYTSKEQIESIEEIEPDQNNLKWIKVKLISGEEGYVATDYLELDQYINENEQENENDNNTNITNNTNVEYSNEGYSRVTLDVDNGTPGYFGIDTNMGISVGQFSDIINGKYEFNNIGLSSTGNINKPAFVYIKLGATGFGEDYSFVNENNDIESYIRECENAKIPYGFYYFGHSYDVNERGHIAYQPNTSLTEVERIERLMNAIDYKELNYNILPFAYDVEEVNGGRLLNHVDSTKTNTTDAINQTMNQLRDDLGVEVILYTSKNTFNSIIDINRLESQNKDNMWLGDYYPDYKNGMVNNIGQANYDNSKIRQVAIPECTGGAALPITVDINFMEENYYNNLVNERLGRDIDNNEEHDFLDIFDNDDKDRDDDD